MTETEHCIHCVHDLERYDLLLLTLQQMITDYGLPSSALSDIQHRLCVNAGCTQDYSIAPN
jgi:hypothetical protein